MDAITIAGLAGTAVNFITIMFVVYRFARWTGVVDTQLAALVDHMHNLPCRSCGALNNME